MPMICPVLLHKKKSFWIACCIFAITSSAPQDAATADWGRSYPDHLAQGLHCSFSQPRWLFAAGGIAGLGRFDVDVRNSCNGRILPEPLARLGKVYGFGSNYILGSVYILSDRFGAEEWRRQERLQEWQIFSESCIITGATTMIIKKITHRLRPDGSTRDSFPSGHSSTSFCVAAFMNQRYGPKTGAPAMALALVTAISRLHHDRHWLSDALAGALLGGLLGDGFARLEQEPAKKSYTSPQWQINFVFRL